MNRSVTPQPGRHNHMYYQVAWFLYTGLHETPPGMIRGSGPRPGWYEPVFSLDVVVSSNPFFSDIEVSCLFLILVILIPDPCHFERSEKSLV
ncbi:MAG TPA: hypothetical protein PLH06_06185, partial [Candidatus Hydrogenedentes bacterium]|nr:hypothetical protein [Candidatus Hydrogenedentota bacterium]